MKTTAKNFFYLAIAAMLLSGCDFSMTHSGNSSSNGSSSSDSGNDSISDVSSTDTSNVTTSNDPASSDFPSSSDPNSSDGSSSDPASSDPISSEPTSSEPTTSEPTSSEVEANLSSLSFTSSVSLSGSTSYASGNFATPSYMGTEYSIYRAYHKKNSDYFLKLIAPTYSSSSPGDFMNMDAIKGIRKMSITYQCANNAVGSISVGKDAFLGTDVSMPFSSSSVTKEFIFSGTNNYFSISADKGDITIYSLTIYYTDDANVPTNVLKNSGTGQYRINPKDYSNGLKAGTEAKIPMDVTFTSSGYSVNTYKTYKYYSLSDVQADASLASAAAYTDPIDVANYFLAFHTYPANYGVSGKISSVSSIFGDKTRQVSSYSRTSGYVNYLPTKRNGSSISTYYECDIDVTGTYSTSSRGVGRVVVFTGGLDATGYDSSYCAVFTDDHYFSFQECNNLGGWNPRFDAEGYITNTEWGNATTLSA